ncbi:ventricular zone-expressed PH domain-containing protein [Brachionichthys hirsutus]|uniref:ventricular zone-expressed PH domain-containing protein n=1 Tax=Brachionichthys hirsutus TaxID=412623 RepID=UPI003604AC1F
MENGTCTRQPFLARQLPASGEGRGTTVPLLLGHVAKIHGAVGVISETHAHNSLVYLAFLLGSMEHGVHHTLLLEIRALSDRFPSLLGGCGKDIYRMSNSFAAIARLLGRSLEERTDAHSRDETCPPSPSSGGGGAEQRMLMQIEALEENMLDGAGEGEAAEDAPVPQRRRSLSQAVREESRDMRFNRSKSLALHPARSRSINSDAGEDGEASEQIPDAVCSNAHSENQEAPPADRKPAGDESASGGAAPERGGKEAERGQSKETAGGKEAQGESDRLLVHLRDNMETIRAFCKDAMRHIPTAEQCVIEDSNRGCVAKLSFSCPLKGHYCLYAKSCFTLTSRQPHLWIHIMLLRLQSESSVPLRSEDECVRKLSSLWAKTQLKGAHSFPLAMTQHATPHRKDLDSLQVQLEEVRFFDLFGYSEDEGSWLCFMCNNPEKATVVNQEGKPLIEGKLKEKQVRWKFIKRWRTRYFTLAGNQLLFRRGKSKDELDDIPIELSKVQSVKVVARKRRDRGLPRAFEIFTDSKTYVLKAQDEKRAEEWLQCINVAVAQARERESSEATTYL